MATLVIEDMDEALMRDLASFAAGNGMRVDVQAKDLLRRAVPAAERIALATRLDAIAALTPHHEGGNNSLDLLREDRRR